MPGEPVQLTDPKTPEEAFALANLGHLCADEQRTAPPAGAITPSRIVTFGSPAAG